MSAKNHELKIRFEKEDYDKLKRKAERLGLKLSQYCRMVSINFNVDKLKRRMKNETIGK